LRPGKGAEPYSDVLKLKARKKTENRKEKRKLERIGTK
jgi:hypothetical protein